MKENVGQPSATRKSARHRPRNGLDRPKKAGPRQRRGNSIAAPLCRLISSLQNNKKDVCYASARALREMFEVMTGRRVGARSIPRVIKRLTATGEIWHRRKWPGEEVVPGRKGSGCGGQHNRYIPRSLLRAEAKRRKRAERRAIILAEQRRTMGRGRRLPKPPPPPPREEKMYSEDADVQALIAAGEYFAAAALIKEREPPDE